jgi:hypothetical protein
MFEIQTVCLKGLITKKTEANLNKPFKSLARNFSSLVFAIKLYHFIVNTTCLHVTNTEA